MNTVYADDNNTILNNTQKNNSTNTTIEPVDDTTVPQAAAGESTPSFTLASIKSAASSVYTYLIKYKKLPKYVTIGSYRMDMADFLYLMSQTVISSRYNYKSPIKYKATRVPSKVSGTYYYKTRITKARYVTAAKYVRNYINKYKKAPAYYKYGRYKMRFQDLVFTFSYVLRYNKKYKKLPSTMKPRSYYTRKTSKKIYAMNLYNTNSVKSTSPVTNETIISLANSLVKGKNSVYDKAVAIYNWVRDYISYSFYYNTKKGAVGTLQTRSANCCDQSQLMAAMYKAVNITYRFYHVSAKFTSGSTYGHVFLKVYTGNKWYYADPTSNANSFGKITNWYTSSAKTKGIYTVLPF